MGRNARLKKERRRERQRLLNEAWSFFTSRGFLNNVRKMIHDAGADVSSSLCCTKVLVELGCDVGLDIRPLVVETSIFNPVFTKWIEKNGLNPSSEEMKSMGEEGGRYVVLGPRNDSQPRKEETWPGHLVAIMRAKGKPTTVLDLTVDRANRPLKDIQIDGPIVFGAPEDFAAGESVASGIYPTKVGKICFVYRAFPDDRGFEDHPEWKKSYGAKTHDKIDIEEPAQTEVSSDPEPSTSE
jgi:hypothetical protein